MNTLCNLTILLFLTAFIACTTKKQDIKAKDFLVSVKSIKGDTVINSAVYYAGHILCLQGDDKLFVLDTTLNLVDSLTAKFSKLKIQFLHFYNDTILLSTDKDIFYLDTGFVLKKYNSQPFKCGLPYYNDSTYYVHACSAGEWGGAVFFWNKKTNRTYSYPATDVQQVFKFNGEYVVSSFLAHLSGISDYLFIKDPTKMYELKDEKQKTFCNWYMEVDSIKDKRLFDTLTPPGIKYYSDSFTTRTLTTFPYKDEIYSIYCTDSATILAKFINRKLSFVDTLLHHRLTFHNAKTHLTSNAIVTAYQATWTQGGEGNTWTPFQNTGLIFICDNRISFLNFQTPHMQIESNSR